MDFDPHVLGNKSPRDKFVIENYYAKRRLRTSGFTFFSEIPSQICDTFRLIIFWKEGGKNGEKLDKEMLALFVNLSA